MPITILTGMPGAGESKPLITTVNHARELGRVTLTFGDLAWVGRDRMPHRSSRLPR